MAKLEYLAFDNVPDEVRAIYEVTKKRAGRVPNFHKLLAHFPKGLQAHVGTVTALLETSLDPKLRELVFVKVSQVNGCHY